MECLVCGKDKPGCVYPESSLLPEAIGRQLAEDESICADCAKTLIADAFAEIWHKRFDGLSRAANIGRLEGNIGQYTVNAVVDAFSRDHRTLQANMLCFLFQLIKVIGSRAEDSRYTDARNQYAYRIARIMADAAGHLI